VIGKSSMDLYHKNQTRIVAPYSRASVLRTCDPVKKLVLLLHGRLLVISPFVVVVLFQVG
jgi:hypothetical protein